MPSERKAIGLKLPVELLRRVDEGLAPGETRTAFIEAALDERLAGGAAEVGTSPEPVAGGRRSPTDGLPTMAEVQKMQRDKLRRDIAKAAQKAKA